ncbi:hypothetical protein LOK49_LG10G02268 [Camellia lanceoleosa]|uniref:Uncharacterized protein n=1 Tax=Camellia lanceoleosa TaxID=1840588 RepID=A0ACC0GC53_9ERIC|nr:hypothetical protein LOK49_LG10G02268 [Camellia lanceoleosa]
MSSFDPIVSIKVSSSMDGYPVKIPKGYDPFTSDNRLYMWLVDDVSFRAEANAQNKSCMMQIHQKQFNT